MTKFDIIDLACREHETIMMVKKQLNPVLFENTERLLDLFWSNPCGLDSTRLIFFAFKSLTQKHLTLSFLSTLRQHDNQSMFCLRYAMESFVLSIYGLQPNVYNDFYKIQEGIITPKKEAKDKAYKHISKNHAAFSEKLKSQKKAINENNAHPNILSVSPCTNFDKDFFWSHFLDKKNIEHCHLKLWWIGNICIGFLDFLINELSQFEDVKWEADLQTKFEQNIAINNRFKEELKPLFLKTS